MTPARSQLVLSIFPGIGLLDRGFEAAGFSVVRGPDTLWGGDVRQFHVAGAASQFTGIIGGPPCQKFSLGNRNRDVDAGMELVREYLRIVTEAQPDWWMMENVPGSPSLDASQLPVGYAVQLFTLDASHVGSQQRRLRKFHFGHRPGTRELVIGRGTSQPGTQRTCLASEGRRKGRRSWAEFCALQGLPAGFDLPGFTVMEKFRAVGNGVPYPLALALAQAIRARDRGVTPHRVCPCGCGEYIHGKEQFAAPRCRKREQRRRDLITPAASQLELA